ncbi:MAG TPA: RHS repeat-associated core domain-containing protein, partial [Pyrinomonadaceae bacterium]
SQSYTYDPLNRLDTASESNGGAQTWQQRFTYDQFGNRRFNSAETTQNVLGPNPSISTANNRITESGYGYDAAGNLTNDPQHSYSYDGENRLQTNDGGANANSGVAATYVYDGDGRRVRKAVGLTSTLFVYNALGQLVAEYNGAASNNGTSYVTADTLGSTRIVTGSAQEVKSRHDYLPFGEEINAQVVTSGRAEAQGYRTGDVRQKFTGKERETETGLDYFLARYYSSAQGRFTSPDEFTGGPDDLFDFADDAADNPTFYADLTNPQSLNKYQYGYNNPINLVDPDGHCIPCVVGAAVAVASYILLSFSTVHAPRLTDRHLSSSPDSASQIVALGAAEAVGGPLLSRIGGRLFSRLTRRSQAATERAALRAEREKLVRLLHKRELSYDPAIKGFRPAEGEAGYRLEAQIGRRLTRERTGAADFVDRNGRTYDLVGAGLNSRHFNYESVTDQILTHLGKADQIVIDVSRFSRAQTESIEKFVSGLSSQQARRVIFLR